MTLVSALWRTGLGNAGIYLFFMVTAYDRNAMPSPVGGPVSLMGFLLAGALPLANICLAFLVERAAQADHFSASERADRLTFAKALYLSALVLIFLAFPACMAAKTLAGE